MLADLLIGLLEVAMDSLSRRKLTKVEKAASQLGLLEPLYSVSITCYTGLSNYYSGISSCAILYNEEHTELEITFYITIWAFLKEFEMYFSAGHSCPPTVWGHAIKGPTRVNLWTNKTFY